MEIISVLGDLFQELGTKHKYFLLYYSFTVIAHLNAKQHILSG